ncbi:DUF397 domain-containing protein [Amycolatopsis saalfeldensis]|uniref:DUF397 domain-containing protein n=1 Tax=Amycolatopsis saalfeldensis TaxID=394193 RepID=UPI000B881226|nr:DUF397 domain-containing protein [Amycolatopsis saalfeldensis]
MHLGNRPKWQKSSRSINDNNCVEILRDANSVHIRDSQDPTGPTLLLSNQSWDRFTGLALDFADIHGFSWATVAPDKSAIRSSLQTSHIDWHESSRLDSARLKDIPQLGLAYAGGEPFVVVRQASEPEGFLIYTVNEWLAFIAGIELRDFEPDLAAANA